MDATARRPPLPLAVPRLDALLAGGLRRDALHEIGSTLSRDSGAATGFAAAVLARLASVDMRPILWVVEGASADEAGVLYGAGLGRMGLDPNRLIVVRVKRPVDALWVAEEGLACRGLAAVIAEIRGSPRLLDLTATRRLALRARSGVMGLLLRQTAEAEPSAATTRWRTEPLPATTLGDYAAGIGLPAWRLILERNRRGATGAIDVEWDHARRSFAAIDGAANVTAGATHPLPVPAVPVDRPAASAGTGTVVALRLPLPGKTPRARSAVASPWPADSVGAPLAVVAKVKNALRLTALDETAERLGLVRGLPLADARAMIPSLEVADDDSTADAALLESIADWAERYTPLVALDSAGLFLDITGAAHLFGGEAALAADIAARLFAQGFHAGVAIARGPGAAWAAARFMEGAIPIVVAEAGAAEMLAPLPLAALRLDPETVSALDRVGLKRIGQVIGAPRGPLAARFGGAFIRRLDQALGLEEEAISPRRPLPVLIAERRFAEPISREEDVAATLASLASTLAQNLETHGLGARRLELALFRVDGVVARIAVGTAKGVRAPKLVSALFREKFAGLAEEIDAGFGYDMARLSVLEAAPHDPVEMDLTGEALAEADLDGLIDRIGARLGPEHVTRIAARDSHIPERAEAHAIAAETPGPRPAPVSSSDGDGVPIDRPLRLFARPEMVEAVAAVPDGPPVTFRWRRATYRVARAEGPERIAAEWWHEDALTRDYFRVEDAAGHRFWLYREGLYGRELNAPGRWYLHGVFA